MRHFWRRWLPGLLLAGTAPLFVLAPLFFAAPRPLPQTPVPTLSPTSIATIPPPTLTPTSLPTAIPTPPPTPTPALVGRHFIGYVPILMYHYIREVDPDLDELGFRLSVLPERFEAQMEWLYDNGYTPLRMSALATCLRGEAPCPPRPVAITFDDGYLDNATTALPILKRFGFQATFYVVPGLIGREGYMNWRQVQLLHDNGMEIGAHTVSHADLTTLSHAEARFEIEESRRILEERLGSPVLSFSYPAGQYNKTIVKMAYDAGFSSAVTTYPGDSVQQLYELPRRRVLGGEALVGFKWYFVPPSRLTS